MLKRDTQYYVNKYDILQDSPRIARKGSLSLILFPINCDSNSETVLACNHTRLDDHVKDYY